MVVESQMWQLSELVWAFEVPVHKQVPYGPLKTLRVFSLAHAVPTLRRNELPSFKIQEIFT